MYGGCTYFHEQRSLSDGGHALQGVHLGHQHSVQQLGTKWETRMKLEEIQTEKQAYQQAVVLHLQTDLDVADGVALFVHMLTVGDHLFDLSALKEVQLQQLR